MNEESMGILIIDHPAYLDTNSIINNIKENVSNGIKVFIYLLDEGVYFLQPEYWNSLEKIESVVYACGFGAKKYQVPFRDDVIFASLFTLAQLIKSCTYFIAFQADASENINFH